MYQNLRNANNPSNDPAPRSPAGQITPTPPMAAAFNPAPFQSQTPTSMNKPLVLISALGLSLGLASTSAQAPALSIIQQLALAKMVIPTDLTAAAAAAQSALTQASLTTPANPADVSAKAAALAQAELALAMARASEFSKVEASLEKITPAQAVAAAGRGGRGGGGGGRGGAVGTPDSSFNDHTGFVSLFDGKTFTGWNGEADIWEIQDGTIFNDNSKHSGQHHIHYVGGPGLPGPILGDFDLKLEFKATTGANAGVQYRSRLLTGHGANRAISDPATMANPLGEPLPAGITTLAAANAAGITGQPWQISGYQFDIYADMSNTGSLYEGQGRGVVANQGQVVQLLPDGGRNIISQIVDIPGVQYGKLNDWNQVEIIARGNTVVHILNGHVFCVGIDDDPVRRAMQGILSLQLEASGTVAYRNLWLKKFNPAPDPIPAAFATPPAK